MAAETGNMSVNGDYGMHQMNGTPQQPSSQGSATTNANASSGAFGMENTNVTGNNPPPSSTTGDNNIPKDEVGWYFVEQYYTTLSRNPEKLHLFYSKRSQFVSGVEAEKVSVSVGQRAISERIKELDIQDCKVRVSNVDSQESFKNIVVQVIGEMSNKAEPHRKFVQTFVLAEQPNGYFVLNDILRYINEEEEIEEPEVKAEPEPNATASTNHNEVPATLSSTDDSPVQHQAIDQVDKKLEEETALSEKEPSKEEAPKESRPSGEPAIDATDNNNVTSAIPADDAPAAAVSTERTIDDHKEEAPQEPSQDVAEVAAEEAAEEESIQPEKPQDPDPTPIASPPKPAKSTPVQAAAPAAPPKPAAPKTWANLVAANRIAAPVAPSPVSSTSPGPQQTKPAAPPATQAATPPISASEDSPSQAQQPAGSGWQTAGTDNNKRQVRQQSVSGINEKDNVLGYVKNVTERVDASILKSTLLQYGKLAYFDVSRQKNCAFVEFTDAAGYNAAVAGNPHSIGGEQIYVEERRPRSTAYGGGFNGRGGIRGGRGGSDGRQGSQGRGGYPKDGGRGGFIPRGRGGNMTPRGRGQPQPA